MSQNSSESLVLPDVASAELLFSSVYLAGDDSAAAIAILPDSSGEWLFIDADNDEDLSNDGDPRFFSADENEFTFDVHPTSDPRQIVRRVFYRIPAHILRNPPQRKHFETFFFDEHGNLGSPLLRRTDLPADFTGRRGTFYFDDRMGVRRGRATFGDRDVDLGLFDATENGRFDDADDLLFVDFNQDGKLGTIWSEEVFTLDDVLAVGDMRWAVTHVDPYGDIIRFARTDRAPTAYYMAERDSGRIEGITARLDPTFWDLELATLDGGVIRTSDLRGRHVLLAFWGEWCAPCVDEMPDLVEIHHQFAAENLQLLGMLLTFDSAAARELMERFGVDWPQIILTQDLQEQFRVRNYPTNLLILPDGESYVRASRVNATFVRQYVE